MKHLQLVFLVGTAAASFTFAPSFAQTAAPQAPASPPPAAEASQATSASPGAAPSTKQQEIHRLRESCRDAAKGEGRRGADMREAISACVVKARPDLSGREQCRADAFAKGLRKEAFHDFVKDCAKSKG